MAAVWTITYDNGSGPVEQSAADWGLNAQPIIRTRDRSPTTFSFRMAGAAPEGGIPFPFKSKVIIKQNRTFAAGDRFAGAGKVMLRVVSGGFAGSHSPLDGILKTPPLAVSEHGLQVTGAPVLRAMLVGLPQFLERPGALRWQLFVHWFTLSSDP